MFRFNYLDKIQKTEYLPLLFDILHSNMKEIAPSGISYDEERSDFLREVSSALDKAPRQIVLVYSNDELVGFLMYYTRDNMIMIEELQIAKNHQRTRALKMLCKYMISCLPDNIEFIESFAHKTNTTSLALQNWLGMEIIAHTNDTLCHLKGSVNILKNKIR